MNSATVRITPLIREYQKLVGDKNGRRKMNKRRLNKRLVTASCWTPKGADHLIHLAETQGTFVLRNALALAIALGIEDGEIRM